MEFKLTPTGEETVTMTREEYEDLLDGAILDRARREIADGSVATIADADMDAYLAAPTPLAFWRKHRGLTQQELADAAAVSQPYVAQIENGQREATTSVLSRMATRLNLRVDDLLP